MSTLEAVAYAPKRVSHRRFKKTSKVLNVTPETLDKFAKDWRLTAWQKQLVAKVAIERWNFSHIAVCCGCSKQYVSQEYSRIYNKVMGVK